MTLKQAEAIKFIMKRKGLKSIPEAVRDTDATLQFTDEEIEKCQNVETTAMTTPEASQFLILTRNIATWRKQVGTGMCDQWIKQIKEMIKKF